MKIPRRKIKNITKHTVSLALVIFLATSLFSGCGIKKEIPVVPISLWCDEGSVELLNEELDAFKELHKGEAIFEFSTSVEGEDTCKEVVLNDPEAAADIYMFADDQFEELYRNGALLKITKHQDEILEGVGGKDSGAAQAVLRDGEIYSCPVTAGNGYFLYYNKAYFSQEDVKSLDRILEVASENHKKFSMDYSSGWYTYSFFKGAGLSVNATEDGNANECDWNSTTNKYTGLDVASAMSEVASHDGFINCTDDGFVAGVANGSIIAGINGAWNASKVQSAWGEDYAATKLPTYTIGEEQLQMCSFTGYKLMGINAHTAQPDYCMELVYFLTNEENQLKRFELTGECPANLSAAATQEVQDSPAVAALALQSQYGYVQSVAEPYWAAASKLGIVLASGNRDNRDLQEVLDETQAAITAASKDNLE